MVGGSAVCLNVSETDFRKAVWEESYGKDSSVSFRIERPWESVEIHTDATHSDAALDEFARSL